MSDLRDYIDQQMSGATDADADPEPEDGAEDTGAAPVTGDAAGDDDPEATAFYDAMTPAQRERAETDEEYLAELWDAWTAEGDDASDATAEDDEDEDDDYVPTSGADVVAWAYEHEADLRAEGWKSVEEFLVLASSDARWWISTATLMGWPPETRPQQRDLPVDVGMAAIAAGVPGARLVEDPLHRMRPTSKRRLW